MYVLHKYIPAQYIYICILEKLLSFSCTIVVLFYVRSTWLNDSARCGEVTHERNGG